MPDINIIILACNRLDLTRTCLESLMPTLPAEAVLTVVDNGSSDGTPDYLAAFASGRANMRVLRLKRNMGVAVGVNMGLAAQDAEYHLKLDNDMEILRPDWLDTLLELAQDAPELGLVGYRCCSWHTVESLRLSSGKDMLDSPSCGGGCMLIPRRTFQRIGFWCEDHGRYGFGDLEYSNRARLAGFVVGYADRDDAVRHLGYEVPVDSWLEKVKLTSRSSEGSGQKLYLLNKFLFEEGIRDLYVSRKYLPLPDSGKGIAFAMDEAYKPILKLHGELLEKVDYRVDGDVVRLDLGNFRKADG